jgi:hypothetical protein
MKQTHSNIWVDYSGNRSFPTNGVFCKIKNVTHAAKNCKFIFAYDDIFYSCTEVKNGIFYYVLQYIGPAADAAKYKYKLRFSGKECTENLEVTLLVRSLNDDLNEVHNSSDVILLPDMFNRFTDGSSALAFSLQILKV